MDEKLKQLTGKRIDVNCGAGSVFRGVVEDADDKILVIKDENDLVINISINKIIAVTECVDPVTRPGFIV
ncbi:MAG: MM0924 family protein [Pyrinomonadaceae bacterium]